MSTTVKSDAEVIAQLEGAAASMAAALADVDYGRLSDEGSLAVLGVVEKMGRRVDGARVSSATDVAVRADSALGHESLAYKKGCRGKFELITGVTRVSGSEAKRRMRLGALVAGGAHAASGLLGQDIPVQHPAVAEGLASGELGVDAAEVIVNTLEPLSRRCAPEDLDKAERALVASATGAITPETEGLPGAGIAFSSDLIRGQAHEWEARLDPDGAAPSDEASEAKSTVAFGRFKTGLYPLRGGVTPELRGILDGIFNTYLSAHSAPAFPSAEQQALIEAGEVIPGAEEFDDPRTGGEKRADILRGVFEATARDTKTPTMGGGAPTVMVHVNAADLKSGTGVGWVDGVEAPISLRNVRQKMCAGGYQELFLGENGEILRLGEKKRFFTPAQRRAIAARDGGCVIPGCPVAAAWCEVHHVIPWQHNGKTDVANGTLLCWLHHHTIDTAGWEIRMINGRPWVRGPVLFDPTRTWRQARSHRANTPSRTTG